MYSINYKNIFTFIVKFNTFRVFLIIVALKNLECYQVNVNDVFTKFFFKKIIYITVSSEVKIASDCVLHIQYNLYNLKQAAQNWYEWCIDEIMKLDFHQSNINFYFFLHSVKRIMLLLYINDIIVTSANLLHVFWFKKVFVKMFKIKNLKKTQKILSIWVTHNYKKKTLHLNQTHHVNKMLKDFHI